MDREKKGRGYDWVRAAMPLLPARISELRAQHGDAHINECWRRGVVRGERGWFFARQGSVALGAPFDGVDGLADWAGMQLQPDQVIVLVRPAQTKGDADGAH